MNKKFKENYLNKGTAYIEKEFSPFSQSNLTHLERYCAEVKKEHIKIGDAGESNWLLVGRFQSDKDRPRLVNKNTSTKLFKIINKLGVSNFVRDIIEYPNPLFIRRIQFNQINKDGFVGYHLDTDSNPDYLVACVLQLGSAYGGGMYRVHQPNKSFVDYKPNYHSLIISNCSYPHEVTRVTKGIRKSLVFFYANHNKKNKRHL